MSDTTESEPAALPVPGEEPFDKQVRLRSTAGQKAHLEKASVDAGYKDVSEFLRHVLFDNHLLVVGPTGRSFVVVPAWSADPDEREAAELNIAGLLQVVEVMGAAEDAAELPPMPPALPPEGPPEPVAAAPPVVASEPAPAAAVAPPLAAVGPVPLPDENLTAFVERRKQELQLAGRTPLVAGAEAEAEWRAAAERDNVSVQDAAEGVVPAAPEDAPQAFCTNCGTPVGGGRFCAGCGAQLQS